MKPGIKRLLTYALLFGTLGIVLWTGLRGQEVNAIPAALAQLAPKGLAFCLICYALGVLCDSVSMHYFLRRQGHAVSLKYAVFISLIGTYYSNVTPGASGGQPMQIYYLKKAGVPVGIGTSATTVKYFCYQIMLMLLCTVLWIVHGRFLNTQVGANRWIMIFGYAYNLLAISLVLLMAVNIKLVRLILRLILRVGAELRLVRHPDALMAKWADALETFHASVMMLRRSPVDLMIQLGIGLVQVLSLMLVPVCLFHAFGLNNASATQLIALGLMLYVSAAYMPLPGASGAQEGIFSLYFGGVFPGGTRLIALLLWRFFTYYFALIVGAAVSLLYTLVTGGKKNRPEES